MYTTLKKAVIKNGVDEYNNGGSVVRKYLHEPISGIDFYAVLKTDDGDSVSLKINLGSSFSDIFITMSKKFTPSSQTQTVIVGKLEAHQFNGYIMSTYDYYKVLSYNLHLIQQPKFGFFASEEKKGYEEILLVIERCYKIGIEWYLKFLRENNL